MGSPDHKYGFVDYLELELMREWMLVYCAKLMGFSVRIPHTTA